MLLKIADFNIPNRLMPKISIIFGQDPAFVQYVKDGLIQNWLAAHSSHNRRRWRPEGQQDWDALQESFHQFDLFYTASVQDISLTRKADDKAALSFIESVLSSTSSDAYVFSSTNLELKQVQRFSTQKDVLLCQIVSPSKAELLRHAQSTLFQDNRSLAQEVSELIYNLSQGNTDAYLKIVQQLQASKAAGQSISLDLVHELYPDESLFTIQDMVDACIIGDAYLGIKSMTQLCADRNNISLLIWVLAQELRNLLNMCVLSRRLNPVQAFDALKIWPKKRSAYQSALHRLTIADLQAMTIALGRVDVAFKTFQEEALIRQRLVEIARHLAQGQP